jgi:hypothetical protein
MGAASFPNIVISAILTTETRFFDSYGNIHSSCYFNVTKEGQILGRRMEGRHLSSSHLSFRRTYADLETNNFPAKGQTFTKRREGTLRFRVIEKII